MEKHRATVKSEHLLSALILALALLIYVNTFSHDFVFDDAAVLVKNEFVQSGLGGIKDIFTTGSWDGYQPEEAMHIYRPLQLTALALQYEFFELNPRGYHIVHVLSYALLCCLIFRLLDSLFVKNAHGRLIALTATLLYTVHPVHTEVVANIKGNGDLLSMLLGVVALIFIAQYMRNKAIASLVAASLVFLLALLTKETIVCFVGVAGLLLFFFSDFSIKRILLSTLPLFLVVGMYLLIRAMVFGADAQTLTETTEFDNFVLMADGISQEIGLRLYALGKNLQLCLIPYPLQFMYVYDAVPMVEIFDIRAILALAAYLFLGCAFLLNLRKHSICGFAIGFYFVTIALFSNVIFSIPNILSERWLLIPSLGICILLSQFLVFLYQQKPIATAGAFSLIMLGYTGYTVERNQAWQDNLTLFRTDLARQPKIAMGNKFVVKLLTQKASENNNDPEILKEAAYYQERYVELAPRDAAQHKLLGDIYAALGENRKAAEAYKIAASFEWNGKDTALKLQARNLNKGGFYQEALEYWRTLDRSLPQAQDISVGYATALFMTGKTEDANIRFDQALKRIEDTESETPAYLRLNNHGILLEELGAYGQAAKAFKEAAKYNSPIKGKALFSQAKNLNLARMYSSAVPLWQALDVNYPNLVDVKIGKAISLIGSGMKDSATQSSIELINLLATKPKEQIAKEQCIQLNSIAVALENESEYAIAAKLFGWAATHETSIQGKAAFSEAKNLNAAELFDEAIPKWRQLEQEYPGLIDVSLGLARALEGTGSKVAAMATYASVTRKITEAGLTPANQTKLDLAKSRMQILKQTSAE